MDNAINDGSGHLSRRSLLQLGGTAALAGTGMVVFSPREAFAAEPATVSVDAGTNRGTYNNPADYFNTTGIGAARPNGKDDAHQARWVNGKIVRFFASAGAFYDHDTKVFDFTKLDSKLDRLATTSDRIMLANGHQQVPLFDSPAEFKSVYKQALLHAKDRCPTIEWQEAVNEPNVVWNTADYYEFYKLWYEIVNEVNAELDPQIPIKVGGPITAALTPPGAQTWVQNFLDLYAADTDPDKKLDFIGYHQYRIQDLHQVANHVTWLRDWLDGRDLPTDIPIFLSEYGMYAGSVGPSYEEDILTEAAGKAAYAWHAIDGSVGDPTGIIPLHWITRTFTNTRTNWFVDLDSDPGGDELDGVSTPTFNVFKMHRMLKQSLLTSDSDQTSGQGQGVRAIATKDGDGVAVLLFNYQGNGTFSAPQYDRTVVVNNLPSIFNGKNVHSEVWVVDEVRSNYFTNNNVEDTRLFKTFNGIRSHTGGQYVTGLGLLRGNAVQLIRLTPTSASLGPGWSEETIADAWVDRDKPTTNFGTRPVLSVMNHPSNPDLERWAYLKFDLTGLTDQNVADARLRLLARIGLLDTGGPITTQIHAVVNTSWNEDTITWNTKPAVGTALDTVTVTGNKPAWYELNITNHIQQELAASRTTISLALRNTSQTGFPIHVATRETVAPPQLAITE